jgi:hypothetical protein
MENSKAIAALAGPTFMALGAMLLLNQPAVVTLVNDPNEGPMFVMFSGILAFVAGIAIVRVHNLWVKDWRVVITLVGWWGTLVGLGRMLFPAMILRTAFQNLGYLPYALPVVGFCFIALGAFLSYHAARRP